MAKASQQKKASFSVEPEKVLRFCQDKLKPLLGNNLEFIPLLQDPKSRIFELITKDLDRHSTTTGDRDNRHNLVRLSDIKSDTYWINISLTFLPIPGESQQKTKPQSFRFSSISIRVFNGLMTDEKKQPLFRAEWDTLTEKNNHTQPRYNHAQPHWHVYKSFQIRDLTPQAPDFESSIQENDVKDFGEFAEEFNFSEKENNSLDNQEEFDIENDDENLDDNEESLDEYDWDSSTKFHFAMSSQWHNKGTHKVILDKDELLYSWLGECVKYIKEQLKYVSGDRAKC